LWRVAYGAKPGMTKDRILKELPQRFGNFLPGPGEGYTVKQANSYRPINDVLLVFGKVV